MCKIQKNFYFQTRSERLSMTHIERFHSRGQHLWKFIETKENVYIRKEFNSHRTGLRHHGRHFIVLGHQYGRRNVMWKHSIKEYINRPPLWKRSMLTSLSKFLSSTEYQIFSSMRQSAKILAESIGFWVSLDCNLWYWRPQNLWTQQPKFGWKWTAHIISLWSI